MHISEHDVPEYALSGVHGMARGRGQFTDTRLLRVNKGQVNISRAGSRKLWCYAITLIMQP
jgi:hypothetical protein